MNKLAAINLQNLAQSIATLSHGDTLLVHADAGVAAQCDAATRSEKLNQFVSALKHYFYDGTLLVPSFTYSATQGKITNIF